MLSTASKIEKNIIVAFIDKDYERFVIIYYIYIFFNDCVCFLYVYNLAMEKRHNL